jgi:GTP-binding protein Era
VDKIKPREKLLPFLQETAARHGFRFVVPLSAPAGENLESLVQELEAALPQGEPMYPPDQITDMSTRAWIGEVVREKLIQRMEKELPYAIAVEVEQFQREGELLRAAATIWVEREGQKAIVIGKGGRILKEVGQAARYEIENELGCKVFLQLWVKVRDDWSDSDRLLRTLGYEQ